MKIEFNTLFIVLIILGWLYILRQITFSYFKNPGMKTIMVALLFLTPAIGVFAYLLFNQYLIGEKRKFQPIFNER